MAEAGESLSTFHALFDELIVKKLSASGVEKIRDAAALNFHEPAPLVEAIVEAQKRATGATKLAAFYLVDAIVRHARDVIKRKASGGYAYKDAKAPEGSDAEDGTKQAMIAGTKVFLEAVGGVLQDLSLDAMRGVRAEQREKIYKIIDIWTKVEVSDADRLKALRRAVEELEVELGPGETSSSDAGKEAGSSSSSTERKKRDDASARKEKKRDSASQKANGSSSQAVAGKATRNPLEGTSSSATATPEPAAAPGLPSHLLALLSGNMSGGMSPKVAPASTPPPEDGRLSPASAALQSETPAPPPPQATQAPPIVPSTVLSSLANLLGSTPAHAPATAAANPMLNASQLALLQQLAASGSTPPQRPPQPLPSVSSSQGTNNTYARPPVQQPQAQHARRPPPPQQQQWAQRPPPSVQASRPPPTAARPYPPPSSTAPDYSKPPPPLAQSQPPSRAPTVLGAIRPLGMVGHKPAVSASAKQPPPAARIESPARATPPFVAPAEQSSTTGVKRSAERDGYEDAKRMRSRSPQYTAQPMSAQGSRSGGVPKDASAGDLSGFNLAAFDATKPAAWTELAQRWYNTQGYHPNQQELLWWIMAMQQQQQMMAWSAQAGWNMNVGPPQSDASSAAAASNTNGDASVSSAVDPSAVAWGQPDTNAQSQQQHPSTAARQQT